MDPQTLGIAVGVAFVGLAVGIYGIFDYVVYIARRVTAIEAKIDTLQEDNDRAIGDWCDSYDVEHGACNQDRFHRGDHRNERGYWGRA